ncbi:MAG TPA: glycosyl transferase family 2 [Chromatiaceae bacterium]|jgi:rSAM/selenodomain-associated transferase 2|nr:MAG: hypothetical protein N838_15065 [Thiohalocapsa sp. PB-PSB1]QQO52816.1 MAG: glycosyltransferase family 2 protein [Thiohalocapsa sp. PB-PSB1]HBG94781.1 glycosyl transferase family 2 [Chromatiaceae bacterium]HCS91391.1 glycosyl transferase family 2 [Chromatiaceae bacterium]
MPKLSIVIPTRRFEQTLVERIRASTHQWPDREIIIVEPEDHSAVEVAESTSTGFIDTPTVLPEQFRLLRAARGRGTQCNVGARAATGELLLFLHDDTELPVDAMQHIGQVFSDPKVEAACFRLRFDRDHWLLRVYAAFSHYESIFTTFGDQGLVIRRKLFDTLGGFPDWPLFEDVELARRIRRCSRIVKLRSTVTTSAVRFERNGMIGQQMLNANLMLRYLLGAKAETLVERYEHKPVGND